MNYLPFCGYWFYGALNAVERAAYYDSWGLLSSAPAYVFVGVKRSLAMMLKEILKRR